MWVSEGVVVRRGVRAVGVVKADVAEVKAAMMKGENWLGGVDGESGEGEVERRIKGSKGFLHEEPASDSAVDVLLLLFVDLFLLLFELPGLAD